MAATEASAAPVVQEDGSKPTEAEQTANTNSETVNKEVVDKDKDASTVNSEVVDNKDGAAEVVENKENVTNDTEAAVAENGEGKAADGASGEADATPADSENAAAAAAEHKTSFLDSFLNKSGLGKVMGGRKKKDPAATGGEEAAEEAGAEKAAEEPATEGAAAAEGEAAAAIEKAPENEENKEEEKKAEKKPAETKSSVRDLIRNPVARMFSHRSTEKKDGEPQKKKVRSKSLDRLADAEALNASGALEADSTIEEGAAAATGGAEEEEQKAATPSAATTKHMKRWHSFKKLMAQKAHKKAGGSTEEVKEEGEGEGEGEGGGDSSTLDSKESGQKRWKLKRSWTFQGMKRDSSMVGISGKTKDKDSTDNVKADDATAATEGAEEAKEDGGEENKTEGEGEKAEGGEEEKAATAAGGTVTQHANEIWTNFKKRVIPKSKRANTECAPSGEEEEATAAATECVPSGKKEEEATTETVEDGAAATAAAAAGEEGKDGKSAKAKRTHFNRAVSLKNFIMRKGKSSSVDLGEGAKEEGEGSEGGTVTAAEGGATDGETVATTTDGETAAVATDGKTTTNNDKKDDVVAEVAEKMAAVDIKAEPVEQVEKTPKAAAAEVPVAVTNGENGCTNGNSDDHNDDTHNHNDTTEGEGEEKKTKVVVVESPVKKKAGAKDAAKDQEANAKIINATAPATVNSDKKAGNV